MIVPVGDQLSFFVPATAFTDHSHRNELTIANLRGWTWSLEQRRDLLPKTIDDDVHPRARIVKVVHRGHVAYPGQAVHMFRGGSDPTDVPDQEFTYVRIGEVGKKTSNVDFSHIIRGDSAPSRARRLSPKGSVIISTVRPNMRVFAYIDRDTSGGVFSGGLAVLESRDDGVLMNKALCYAFIFSEDLMAQIINASPRAAYPSINMEDIRASDSVCRRSRNNAR